MTLIYKIALAPVLLVQGRHARANTLRLPEAAGAREGTCGGTVTHPPLRVLLVGDSSAAGVGVDHQDDALASQVAALLGEKTGRSVEWQLVAKSGIRCAEALPMLACHELKPAQLVITALGVNDVTGQISPRQFISDYRALIEHVRDQVGAQAAIINGVPPMHIFTSLPQPLRWYLGACAKRLDTALREWAQTTDQLAYVPLQWATMSTELARDGFHPGVLQYRQWAERVVESAVQLLDRQNSAAH